MVVLHLACSVAITLLYNWFKLCNRPTKSTYTPLGSLFDYFQSLFSFRRRPPISSNIGIFQMSSLPDRFQMKCQNFWRRHEHYINRQENPQSKQRTRKKFQYLVHEPEVAAVYSVPGSLPGTCCGQTAPSQ